MELSLNDLDALVSKGARQLSKPNSPAQKRTTQLNESDEASVAAGDDFLKSLGYDEYDNYDSVQSTAVNESRNEYEPRQLTAEELERDKNFMLSDKAMKASRLPSAIKNLVAKSIEADTQSVMAAKQVNEDKFAQIRGIMKRSDELMSRDGVITEKKDKTQAASVDYALIKAIVSECLQEQQRNVLNENALKTINIKAGVISLVDNSGNIFRAKLERVGNKNDKK